MFGYLSTTRDALQPGLPPGQPGSIGGQPFLNAVAIWWPADSMRRRSVGITYNITVQVCRQTREFESTAGDNHEFLFTVRFCRQIRFGIIDGRCPTNDRGICDMSCES